MRTTCSLVCLVLCLATAPAFADTPGVSNCIVPSMISVVGLDGGGSPAPSGQFAVFIRDLANNPVSGATVKVSLASVTDAALCAAQPDAALTVDCAGAFVSKVTDEHGMATFTLSGRGTGSFSPEATGCRAQVYWGETFIGMPVVTTFDLDGSGDVGGGDMGRFLEQFGSGTGSLACDYDNSGTLGGGDFAFWLTAFASGEQIQSGGTLCP